MGHKIFDRCPQGGATQHGAPDRRLSERAIAAALARGVNGIPSRAWLLRACTVTPGMYGNA